MDVSDAKRLRQLEDENRRLKQIVAEQTLDIQALKEVQKSGRAGRPSRGGPPDARPLWDTRPPGVSAGGSGAVDVSVSQHARRHGARAALRAVAAARRRFGYRRLHLLLRRQGWPVNHKRVYRLYRAARLLVRRRRRKHVAVGPRLVQVLPTRPNQRWSMDFVRDTLAD